MDTHPTINPALLALTRKRVELQTKLVGLRQRHGLAFYRPHKKQDLFHRAGRFKYRYLRSGNRFGKSMMGAAEDCGFALGERPWYPRSDPARRAGIPDYPCKILIICNDWDKSTEIFTNQSMGEPGKLWKLLPPDSIKGTHKNHSGAIDIIALQGGGSIHIDTVQAFKQNPMGQESSQWDGIHVDEPCPKKMFTGASRGLMDRGGKAWFTCTPLTEQWINDMFISRRDQMVLDTPIEKHDKWFMPGSTYDNPYLKPEDIKAFEEELTVEERQCRILGIPLAMSGVIYKEFDYARHVLDRVPIGWTGYSDPPLDYTIRFALDPHPKIPMAALFAATSPLEEVYFFTEVFEKILVPDLCDVMKAITDKRFVVDAVCDPIAWTEDPRHGTTMADDFMDHDVFMEKAVKDPTRGILSVRSNLKRHANWHFSPELEETLWEFDHYNYNPETNKPIDKDDHMMENLYRLSLGGLDYVRPPTEEEYAPIKSLSIDHADFTLPKITYGED